jgi:hypothetical protein
MKIITLHSRKISDQKPHLQEVEILKIHQPQQQPQLRASVKCTQMSTQKLMVLEKLQLLYMLKLEIKRLDFKIS